jgi:hypothetical protein
VALYSKAVYDGAHKLYRPRRAVVARIADSPIDLGTAEEIPIFDPCRDRAYGNYMHWPDVDGLNGDPPGVPDEPG